jgi:hypothetical protein
MGNASEAFDQEGLDLWVISASQFAEDPALMTPDRVMDYLKERADDMDREYQRTPLRTDEDPDGKEWSRMYKLSENADDAVTLARFSQCR